ncbi:MAG: 16S rRNA (cytidine(1402)-2'-O)-methyltransferase [Desulfurella sp.]|jgi:16S rRNA (cytidine1402-2'-O)-methyltransferase|uniref:Ribosomal RNA small subunit methyltransferase I n=1 Tax=Desulfurella multipotens TaxID=79269 RepID=A0A1G6K0K3_9BACT|nr:MULTISPECIES: 16S rRNA (cytidine(1402)-2'-O)-methyltransferase [Desulfurella]AHF97131.1 tetrapyrrole methylase [Desulfurella acetivorans A63]HEX13216.1 16S rRNA (cytidine(1402)-2'-O)-methyltransferase [Desulfurella acetivorans]PMP67589.1 MAG: 16S rRNA (cytidine(1402)-2'-O)-methyltransferase [Desulfurella multipotens]PMP88158.1 MAG: 16S rRNA (cytidine(1402)-2'-O)-methyltransferase [Desulfurella sp.]SDC24487.1 16S rRNA (cytidine1402-2'-O)-methyltransferase [Desulfurella multipotens]
MNTRLYVVATPIGNLKDITYRAIETLNSVDVIFAENPKHSKILLSTYNIKKDVTSYNDHNYQKKIPIALNIASQGKTIALITDAGTPTIQDPGYRIVKAFIEHGYKVEPIPGASAFVCALQASGLATDKFIFLGFLPKSLSKQSKILLKYDLDATIIIYESPNRLIKTLENIKQTLGNRHIVLARELTKVHEEFIRGPVDDVIKLFETKKIIGEFVILIKKNV